MSYLNVEKNKMLNVEKVNVLNYCQLKVTFTEINIFCTLKISAFFNLPKITQT